MEEKSQALRKRRCKRCCKDCVDGISILQFHTGIFHNGSQHFVPWWAQIISLFVVVTFAIYVVSQLNTFNQIDFINEYLIEGGNKLNYNVDPIDEESSIFPVKFMVFQDPSAAKPQEVSPCDSLSLRLEVQKAGSNDSMVNSFACTPSLYASSNFSLSQASQVAIIDFFQAATTPVEFHVTFSFLPEYTDQVFFVTLVFENKYILINKKDYLTSNEQQLFAELTPDRDQFDPELAIKIRQKYVN